MNGVARVIRALVEHEELQRQASMDRVILKARRIVQDAVTQVYQDERRHAEWVDIGGEG